MFFLLTAFGIHWTACEKYVLPTVTGSCFWEASSHSSGKVCAVQSPRKLEYLECQLWILDWVANGGFLENLENHPTSRTTETVFLIDQFGFFICKELFCWAWKSKWRQLSWAIKHLIAVWGMTPFCTTDLFRRWMCRSSQLKDPAY